MRNGEEFAAEAGEDKASHIRLKRKILDAGRKDGRKVKRHIIVGNVE
jgi:hypothetical protein